MDERRKKALVTQDGQIILVADTPTFSIGVQIDGQPPATEHVLDITQREFDHMADQVKTHDMKFDIINNKVILTPKHMKTKSPDQGSTNA